ncbi:monoacylglycerol lipase ABHD12-like [Asbolus verrucosus]|uniref:Monoacylglycerol lipase ABHD12-like n=1 Tax=Asbolus verrucosus TaxID=1661398 RepID=A0A482W3Q1_ASBVE|nr:monoacylglycerol lipase ABHD12-like [Asbolus verrucosus]
MQILEDGRPHRRTEVIYERKSLSKKVKKRLKWIGISVKYELLSGFRNLYVSVKEENSNNIISLGTWHMLPYNLEDKAITAKNFDFDEALKNATSVLLYFHGTGEDRSSSLKKYNIFRYFFHVVAFDYRSYADSTYGELSESAVVNDCVQLYEWLTRRTLAPIFIWGHSLGAALATRSTAVLRSKPEIPQPIGLILEAPFTKMSDELYVHPYGKIFAWLPWFEATVIKPLQKNGFIFDNSKNILSIEIPVMILCAEDDRYAGSENYSDIKSYGLRGVRNFYVTVDEKENVTLGVWQILPSQLLNDLVNNEYYNYEGLLANGNHNILLYLHGNGGIRSVPLELYAILRNHFHIIAPDYRGYADSTKAELTEDYIVNDIVNLYKWLRGKTTARIFFWGHSLGTGVSTHTVSNLKAQNFVPSGLVLETPFSSVPDVMEHHYFLKLLSWLPWYRATMLDPIVHNGFGFESTKYIVDVDCPIMILHAKDDSIVPYELATKQQKIEIFQPKVMSLTIYLKPKDMATCFFIWPQSYRSTRGIL